MSFFKKIGAIIKKILISRRIIFFISLGFSVFLFFFIPRSTGALGLGIGDILGGVAFIIPKLMIFTIMGFFVLLSQLFCLLAGGILNWVTSPGFVSVSYTNPATNPIIDIGLGLTKNFVNLALVVILVYIAVAIALRLGETDAKKSLARLVLIALLVNFAPVVVGFIVDATNLVMNYFLKGMGTGISNVLTQLVPLGDSIINKLLSLTVFTLSGQSSLFAQALIVLALNSATGIALFLFVVLFMARYVFIWTLVIISPLAFVAWILPLTRGFWNFWWRNIVQWSIIGIPLAFFLYLGARAYELLPVVYQTNASLPGIGSDAAGLFNETFPYFVILAFIYFGFALGLSSSAAGAGALMGLAKKGGAWVGTKAWTGAKTWTEEKTRFREGVGATVKAVEKIPIARIFIPESVRKYGEFEPAITAAEKELDTQSSSHIGHRIATGDIYGAKATAGMAKLVSRGDFQDFFNSFKQKYFQKHFSKDYEKWQDVPEEKLFKIADFRNKTQRLLQIATRGGKHNAILRGDPRMARAAVGVVPGYEKLSEEQAIEKATTEARRQHAANWEKNVVQDKVIVNTLLGKGTEMFTAIDSQVKEGLETTLDTIDKLFTDFINSRTDLAHKTADDIDKAWKVFGDEFKAEHPGVKGYFSAVETDARFRARGWRKGAYIIDEKTGKRQLGTEPGGAGPTMGGAAGIEVVTPTGERKRSREEIAEKKKIREEIDKDREKRKPPRGRPGVG